MLVGFLLGKGEFSQWLVFADTAYLGGDNKDFLWKNAKNEDVFHFDYYFCQRS